MSERRAWSFLTIEGDPEYQGNDGYRDDPHTTYRYDNFVPNHLQVSPGDVAIIRSTNTVIGIAEIAEIIKGEGTKERQRCPVCSDTNINHRKTKHPAWRCKSNHHEFEEPERETLETTTYEARYGDSFRECEFALTVNNLANAVIRPSDQMSIKEIDLARLEPLLGTQGDGIVESFVGKLEPPELNDAEDGDASGSVIEQRRKVLREISVRRGQKKFRDKLIKRYGGRCQISGCGFVELVEAAHIDPYSESGDNSVQNGLLLRSDIHTLFDLGYLAIEPEDLKIRVHPEIKDDNYLQFEGCKLETNGTSGPDVGRLRKRLVLFTQKLRFN
jgi:putative restriction endonuclease